jgi:uncharacterized protein
MRFLCDVMLGKLARYLRLFGFDAVYVRNEAAMRECVRLEPDRVFLTRRRKVDVPAALIRIESEIARDQLLELKGVIKAAIGKGRTLNRCIECNVELTDIERGEIEQLVPEFVYHHYRKFMMCPSCGKVYWEGSHAKGMEELIKEILV